MYDGDERREKSFLIGNSYNMGKIFFNFLNKKIKTFLESCN